MADMTVVLGNGATLLVLVTYLDTKTELAYSEFDSPFVRKIKKKTFTQSAF